MAGYSKRALFQKLGMKPGSTWMLINAPTNYFEILGDYQDITFTYVADKYDGIHVFTNKTSEVWTYMDELKERIQANGAIWFSWFKKSAKLPTEVTEDTIRDAALERGLVDIKVCAVDESWSGLKVVWRKENRKQR